MYTRRRAGTSPAAGSSTGSAAAWPSSAKDDSNRSGCRYAIRPVCAIQTQVGLPARSLPATVITNDGWQLGPQISHSCSRSWFSCSLVDALQTKCVTTLPCCLTHSSAELNLPSHLHAHRPDQRTICAPNNMRLLRCCIEFSPDPLVPSAAWVRPCSPKHPHLHYDPA